MEGIKLADLATRKIVKPPPLFEGFLLAKTITLLASDPHAGKTLLMLDMMLRLDAGLPLFGKFAPANMSRTLFVGQDAPTWDYLTQMQKLIKGSALNPGTVGLLDSELRLNEGLDLLAPGFEAWLAELHYENPFQVLMIDTIRDLHDLDENNSTDAKRVAQVLKRLRDNLYISIIVSHHLAEPMPNVARRARGSSVFKGSVDFQFMLEPLDAPWDSERRVKITCPKSRGGVVIPNGFKIVQDNESVRLEEVHIVDPPPKSPRQSSDEVASPHAQRRGYHR